MNPIEFVYFDLGNVLVHFSHEVACQQMAQVAGVDVDLVRKTVCDGDLLARYERGEISTESFVQEFCLAIGASPDPNELICAGSEIFELNASIIPLVDELCKSDIRVGILSNTCEAHWQYLKAKFPKLLSKFPVLALSFEIGSAKPEAEIYRVACQKTGVCPENIFFTDDLKDNVDGARHLGMNAHVFESTLETVATLRRLGLEW